MKMQKRKLWHRVLAFVLALVLVFEIMPNNGLMREVMAEEENPAFGETEDGNKAEKTVSEEDLSAITLSEETSTEGDATGGELSGTDAAGGSATEGPSTEDKKNEIPDSDYTISCEKVTYDANPHGVEVDCTNKQLSYSVTYSIKNGDSSSSTKEKPTDAGTYIAEIKITGVGYEEKTVRNEFTISKADQEELVFPDVDNLQVGQVLQSASGGSGNGSIDYTISNEDGKIVLEKDNEQIVAKNVGTATVTATKLGDNNYNDISKTCKVTVIDADFSSKYSKTELTDGKSWYTEPVVITPESGFKISYDKDAEPGDWKESLTIEEGKALSKSFYLKNEDGVIGAQIQLTNLNIDKTGPSEPDIKYNQTTSAFKNWFFKQYGIVTVTANDTLSGIDHFEYCFDNDTDRKIITLSDDKKGTNESTTVQFNIQKDCKLVKIYVYDVAGNCSYKSQSMVVDTKNPSVSFSMTGPSTVPNYYTGNVTPKIKIEEDNLDLNGTYEDTPDHTRPYLVIGCTKYNENESDSVYTDITDKVIITRSGNEYAIQVPEITEDGKYELVVDCTDEALNNTKETIAFTIDTVKPVIQIGYDNNSVENDKYFNEARTATITITEHNFDAGDVNLVVKKDGREIESYKTQVKDSANWTTDGDIHETTICFNDEGEYEVSLEYTDLAGNTNSLTYASGTKASTNFVIDKTVPKVSVKFDNNNVINKKYFSDKRTATVTVEDVNFDPVKNISLVATGKHGTKPEVSWTQKGNIWITKIAFDADDDYTFAVEGCADLAGNEFAEVAYENGTACANNFTVDKTQPEISISYGSEEPKYDKIYKAERTAVIKIKEHNFDTARLAESIGDLGLSFTAIDITGDVIADDPCAGNLEYLRTPANWKKDTDADNVDTYTCTIKFTKDANYKFNIKYMDPAGNAQKEEINGDFAVDSKTPYGLKISYSEAVLDKVLEKISFGFYKMPMTVTLSAQDDVSGVDTFTYSLNTGESSSTKVVIPNSNVHYSDKNKTATAQFKIDPQFRGQIDFFATDKAGNASESLKGVKTIVVDTIAPVIDVTYNNNQVTNQIYYKANRVATIKITEANFLQSDVTDGNLKIVRGIRKGNDTNYTKENLNVTFTKQGDVCIGTVTFDENADYTFDISYTDRSGNVAKSYSSSFTIDKLAPAISVTYDNNNAQNGDQFMANRTAKIVVTEHNFNPADTKTTITAKDASGKNVTVADYDAYLKNKANWVTVGDTHTASITYSAEANYTFAMSCVDLAGNANSGVTYNDSVAPDKFTVDKTIPVASIIVGEWTKSKNGSVWDHFLEDVTFGLWSNEAVTVSVTDSDSLSGIGKIEYFLSSEVKTLAQVKLNKTWTSVDASKKNFTFEVKPNERFIVYTHIVDRAGNELYLSSDGVIVDKSKPNVEQVAPEIKLGTKQSPTNGIYNTDVWMDVTVKDPADKKDKTLYSGLKSVKYEVYNNDVSTTKPSQTGTLLTFTKENPSASELIETYQKDACIKVDKTKNNSNNVSVKIIAMDNSGNTSYKLCDLKIDTTKPTINVSYDNNSADSEDIFKENRTATIMVTERNFNSKDVKIDIKNSDGAVPKVSAWKKVKGSGNEDNTKWKAEIVYNTDGDYEFDVTYTDMASNKGEKVEFAKGSVAPSKFTIDKTLPVIDVAYDNNAALNGNYYQKSRTATITITEHNFSADRVNVRVTAEDDGRTIGAPSVGGWSKNGDKNTATITYSTDALYTFNIDYTDMAGNKAENFAEQSFYVDQTAPEITFSGVEDQSANSGDVIPVITYSDTNFDANQVEISLVGANGGPIKLDGTYSSTHNGRIFTFKNFPNKKELDDIYTLTATLTDKAGNATTESIKFSVNRFGSTYEVPEEVKKIEGVYIKEGMDIVLTEVNADALVNHKVTLFKNNEAIVLQEGTDYEMKVLGGNVSWYEYVYTIYKKNFAEDGVYSLAVYSEDEAGNVAENTLDTKNEQISFGIDKTAPNVVVTNLENHTTYAVNNLTAVVLANDNLLLGSLTVYLDDFSNAYKTWNQKEIEEMNSEGQDFSFDIPGTSNKAHNVKVVCVDAAGNETIEEVNSFYVTTNLWVRFFNNKAVFYGTIAGIIALAGIFTAMFSRKKKTADKN